MISKKMRCGLPKRAEEAVLSPTCTDIEQESAWLARTPH